VGAPSYKIAKKLNTILKNHIHLNNQYTATNSTTLANDLTKLKINSNHRLQTLDIKDLCFNMPIDEAINTTKSQLAKKQHTNRRPDYQIARNYSETKLLYVSRPNLPTR